jgi:hypothetical protein
MTHLAPSILSSTADSYMNVVEVWNTASSVQHITDQPFAVKKRTGSGNLGHSKDDLEVSERMMPPEDVKPNSCQASYP